MWKTLGRSRDNPRRSKPGEEREIISKSIRAKGCKPCAQVENLEKNVCCERRTNQNTSNTTKEINSNFKSKKGKSTCMVFFFFFLCVHGFRFLQWIPSVLRKTLNSCWPKTYGKKDMEKIWKIMGWSALLPKIKKRTKTFRDPTIITFPRFLRTLGGVSTSNVPSYQWLSWQMRTRGAASVRMFDHKREWCTVCSQCAPQPWTSHPFSLDEKVPFGRFQPLSFDFITRNNGSWAF